MNLNEIFSQIFSNKPTENPISMFSWQHILIILFAIGTPVLLAVLLCKKQQKTQDILLKISAYLIIGLYVFDFFIQPFWAGSMTVSKLPFHICTFTGILIAFATFNKKFEKLKTLITVWAILAPSAYVLFPFSTFENTAIYSYSTVQSYIYHIIEIFWGVYMLTTGKVQLKWKTIWQPIVGLFPMALWATIGQELYYPNTIGENFMALRTDVSGIVPHWVYLMALFTAAVLAITLIYGLYNLIVIINKKVSQSKQNCQNVNSDT